MTGNCKSGFTLIETLVYLALFSVLFGGMAAAAYSMFEAAQRSQTEALLLEEGNFLVAKINQAMSGAKIVQSPPPADATSTQSAILSVVKYDGQSVTMRLNESDAPPGPESDTYTLNNSSIQARDLMFTRTTDSASGNYQENVTADFTLAAKTAGGREISEDFSTTVYLRK